jgi:hypothetical protein
MENTSNNIISFDDYYSAIKKEFSKYDVNFETTSIDTSITVTKDMLEQDLTQIREQMETEPTEYHIMANEDQAPATRAIMPYSKTYTVDRGISHVAGNANIRFKIKTTIDAQYNKFRSVDSVSSSQYGGAINFKSWKQNSYSSSISLNVASVTVKGTITTTLNLAGISGSFKADKTVTIHLTV